MTEGIQYSPERITLEFKFREDWEADWNTYHYEYPDYWPVVPRIGERVKLGHRWLQVKEVNHNLEGRRLFIICDYADNSMY